MLEFIVFSSTPFSRFHHHLDGAMASPTDLPSFGVGGHPGITTTEDGSLVIKPAKPSEITFYTEVLRAEGSAFASLQEFLPTFLGVLSVHGRAGEKEGEILPLETSEGELAARDKSRFSLLSSKRPDSGEHCLVLENVAYRFNKPNVLDIKLGTILYDEYASELKKAKMTKQALETTSAETGARLTGFLVGVKEIDRPINLEFN